MKSVLAHKGPGAYHYYTRPVYPIRKHKATSLYYVPRPEFTVLPEGQSDSPLVMVQLNGKPHTALLDSGCSQSLVQSQLVPRVLWNVEETVPVICVHGHEEQTPTAEVYTEAKGQVYLMKVGVATELPYLRSSRSVGPHPREQGKVFVVQLHLLK